MPYICIVLILWWCSLLPAIAAEEENAMEEKQEQPMMDESSDDPAKKAYPFEIKKPFDPELLQQQDLQYYLPEDEIKTLIADGEPFSLLHTEEMAGRAQGVAIFIPDLSSPPLTAKGINQLRIDLADHGWHGFVITLPGFIEQVYQSPLQKKQLTTEESGTKTEPVAKSTTKEPAVIPSVVSLPSGKTQDPPWTTEKYEKYQEKLQTRLQATLVEAKKYPGFFIMIAQGLSAGPLMNLIAEEKIEPPEAVILLAGSTLEPKLNQQLNKNIAQTQVPVLDIYQPQMALGLEKLFIERKRLVRKHFKAHYRQRYLTKHQQQGRLTKEVVGWIYAIGL